MEETLNQVQLAPVVMTMLTGIATPLLAGLITKLQASSGTKALVGVILVALNAVVAWLVQVGGTFHWEEFTVVVFTAFATHVFSYYGVWKPLGGGGAPTNTGRVGNHDLPAGETLRHVGVGREHTTAA